MNTREFNRFFKKVRVTPGCWLWTAALVDGYGAFKIKSSDLKWKTAKAHRVSYAFYFGNPGDLFVMHRCDNPGCVNPDHLELGTNADNMRDMAEKGRSTKGSRQHKAKLHEQDIPQIRARAQSGDRLTDIALDYGVSKSSISKANIGVHWSHVKESP
jgi:hypothetical protein